MATGGEDAPLGTGLIHKDNKAVDSHFTQNKRPSRSVAVPVSQSQGAGFCHGIVCSKCERSIFDECGERIQAATLQCTLKRPSITRDSFCEQFLVTGNDARRNMTGFIFDDTFYELMVFVGGLCG